MSSSDGPGGSAASADRERLIAALRRDGPLESDRVEAALRAVPREAFVPAGEVDHAYEDRAIVTKVLDGVAVSSISQPTMIVWMLEVLAVEPGDHVLEIGAGTGYNAALLAELGGRVVTVDVDADVAAAAEANLRRVGYGPDRVRVIAADGKVDVDDEGLPYDRIIVTAGADRVEPAWDRQLREGGRLVVPITPRMQAYCYVKDGGGLSGPVATSPAGFVPLR